jgi:rhodanese-related sulfurtransferase
MIPAGGDLIVLDVREVSEFCGAAQHIADAASFPWNSGVLQARFAMLPIDHTIIVVCASGGRSHAAANFLDSQGYASIYDMTGGMSAWEWETESCAMEPVVRLDKLASEPEVNWTPATGVQDYDLLRGFVDNLMGNASTVDLGITECLVNDTPFTFHRDSDYPPAGVSHFYLTRQKDGTWGQSSQSQDRVPGSEDCGLP